MIDTPVLDAVRDETARLSKLLADPEPGLFMWQQAVYESIDRLHGIIHPVPAEASK